MQRVGATTKLVIYTLVGPPFMLAAAVATPAPMISTSYARITPADDRNQRPGRQRGLDRRACSLATEFSSLRPGAIP